MPMNQGASISPIPGFVLKARGTINAAGTLLKGLNIASVVKGGTGIFTVNFTAAMASNLYRVRIEVPVGNTSYNNQNSGFWVASTGSCQFTTYNAAISPSDLLFHFEIYE